MDRWVLEVMSDRSKERCKTWYRELAHKIKINWWVKSWEGQDKAEMRRFKVSISRSTDWMDLVRLKSLKKVTRYWTGITAMLLLLLLLLFYIITIFRQSLLLKRRGKGHGLSSLCHFLQFIKWKKLIWQS